MKYNNSIFLIFITLVLSGCIGPLYNPYPLSKLSAKVGPPLKLDTMSIEEQINAEIKAESVLESKQDEILSTDPLKTMPPTLILLSAGIFLSFSSVGEKK